MSKVTRNNVSKLTIKIPNGICSDDHMAYLQKKLPYGWTVKRSKSTGKCYFYNRFTNMSTYDLPNNTPNSGGSRKKTRRRRLSNRKNCLYKL